MGCKLKLLCLLCFCNGHLQQGMWQGLGQGLPLWPIFCRIR